MFFNLVYFFSHLDIYEKAYESSPTGWTTSPSSSLENCGMFTSILGINFGSSAFASKAFSNLPPHYKKRILIRFIKIDNWDSENAILYIDDVEVKRVSFASADDWIYGDHCGMSTFPETSKIIFQETTSKTLSTTIKISSDLNEASSNEAWGFQDFYLAVLRCDGTCKSCLTSSSASDCDSCYEFATLQADKSCKCNDGYYAFTSSPCVTSICTKCNACSTGCKICTASTSTTCTTCFSGNL